MSRESARTLSARRPAFGRVTASAAFVVAVLLISAASATAVPAWSVAPSPSPPGPADGGLAAVSCPTATSCVAVGDQEEGAQFAEHWDGTNWSVMTNPIPSGSSESGLRGVSCPSATNCTAVGFSAVDGESGTTFHTLVEHWNGTTWSIVASPNPSGAHIELGLNSVSCPSATNCNAVGDDSASPSTGSTLVEHWNGTKWSVAANPNPVGATLSSLDGVSCASTTSCNAVGTYQTLSESDTDHTLVEHWNGTTWTIVASPTPSGATFAVLTGVSCRAVTSCNAVGGYSAGSAESTLAEHWNGTAWSIAASPNAGGELSSGFEGVSCASAVNCNAVGSSAGAGNTSATLVEHWNGATWSIVASPNEAASTNPFFSGVSCPTTTSCNAVGEYRPRGSLAMSNALVERWNGASWSLAAPPVGSSQSHLLEVACPTATSCFAVGNDLPGSAPGTQTLIERWNGTTWTVMTSPNPSGATSSELVGVACATATNCTAVGDDQTGSTAKTLVEHWNGTAWSIALSPHPGGAPEAVLSGVACASATDCTAVGDSFVGTTGKTLVEHWNGAAWSLVASPNPSGADAGILSGVACPSTTSCTAAGYSESGLNQSALVEHWNGASWALVASPPPTGAESAQLAGVSCPSTTSCTAVGNYIDSGFTNKTLVEHWSGTTWSVATSPNPVGSRGSSLNDVSCANATSCYAVGQFDTSAALSPVVEHWNGTTWLLMTNPATASTFSSLSGVRCRSALMCTAVGSSSTSFSDDTLVERYA